MDKVSTFLWFDRQAKEAAELNTGLFPDGRITRQIPIPTNYSGGRAAHTIIVAFRLGSRDFIAMNAGPGHPLTDAVSLSIDCEDQAGIDH
jgi:predicted 3-demethylubiquinone-9 3-methyltransferase (glyoxalase superfamily)